MSSMLPPQQQGAAIHAGFFDAHVFGECGAELRRFRVPVTDATTVRQFAQDTLARFVKQTRFATVVEVAVEDVRASGISLFYNDPVCAVVGPSERLELYLLGVRAGDVAPRRLAVGSGRASAAVSPDFVSVTVQPPAAVAAPAAPAAPAASAHLVLAASSGKRGRDTVQEAAQDARPQPPAPASVSRTRGRPQNTAAATKPAAAIAEPEGRKTAASKAGSAPLAAAAGVVDDVRKNELGWGKEAHKSFATNYVSDPDALIRAIRKQKREEKAAAAKAASQAPAANDGDVTFVREVAAASSGAGSRKDKTTVGKEATAAAPPSGGGSTDDLEAHASKKPSVTAAAAAAAKAVAPAAAIPGPASQDAGGFGVGVGYEYRPVGVARVLDFA